MEKFESLREFALNYRDIALFVDFDGTMVDLVPHPDDVSVPDTLVNDLKKINEKPGIAFAIVTGRTISCLDGFLEGVQTPVLGSHGAECRDYGTRDIRFLVDPMPETVRLIMKGIADKYQCIFEDKMFTISMHMPFEQAALDISPDIQSRLADYGDRYMLRKVGRTYEVLQNNSNKGHGISYLMQQPRYHGRTPVYIGDDVYADESLEIVAEMGGTLLPVRHQHADEVNRREMLLSVKDVRDLLAMLSRI